MLFQTIFKDRFERMPGAWQRFHEVSGVHHYKGAAKVVRGSGAFVWLAAGLLGLPQTSDVVLNMRLEADGDGERWQRRFGNHEFSTRLSPARGEARYCLYESYGPFRFCVELIPEHGSVHWHLKKWWLAGLPLPGFTVPKSRTREFTDDKGRYCFEIELEIALMGRLIAYKGWLQPDDSAGLEGELVQQNEDQT